MSALLLLDGYIVGDINHSSVFDLLPRVLGQHFERVLRTITPCIHLSLEGPQLS